MKKNFKLIMFAAAAVAMIGCAKDGAKTPAPEPTGVKTYATVSIAQAATRANPTGSWNDATANESKLHTVDLYVFNANKQLEQVVTIDPATKSATFETVNGNHTLIVLANSPASVVTAAAGFKTLKEIEAGTATGSATLYSEFLAATKIVYSDQATFEAAVISAPDSFFITNIDTPVEANFLVPTDADPTPNDDIDIAIGRAFAKLNASWKIEVQPANGLSQISKMEYTVLHNPQTMYAPQHFDNGTYKSYYHDAAYDGDNYYDWAGTAWKLADETASTYVPENTNKQVVHEGERTALGFRASFVPNPCYKPTLDGTNNFITESYGAGNDFWRIKDLRNGADAWVTGVYFNDKPGVPAAKKALGIAFAETDPVEGTDYACYKYEGGYCYYYLGLERPAGTAPVKYNVARNDYFWVSVDTIQDCGEPTLDAATPTPTDPVSVTVNITAKITLKPWNPVLQSGNL